MYNNPMSYFALCIFLSTFLIFPVQPLIAKYILPWFGGAPAVWSTVQMFFQVLLTGGYAAWVGRPGRGREKWHIALLGLSAFLLLVLGLGCVRLLPLTRRGNPPRRRHRCWRFSDYFPFRSGYPISCWHPIVR